MLPYPRAESEERIRRVLNAFGHVSTVDEDSTTITAVVGRVWRYATVAVTVTATDARTTSVALDIGGFDTRGRGARRALRQIAEAVHRVHEPGYLRRRRIVDAVHATLLAVAALAVVVGCVVLVIAAIHDGVPEGRPDRLVQYLPV